MEVGAGDRRQASDRRSGPQERSEAKDLHQRLERKRAAIEVERRTTQRRSRDLVGSAREAKNEYA